MNEYSSRNKALILLQDGTIFFGKSLGVKGNAYGELCFNTGMTGYQEIFTDPSYFGQLIVTTNAHIGNYGVNAEEVESDSPKISGLICKNFNNLFSRPAADDSLQNFFVKYDVVAISDVDTRALVSYIRDNGAMNAIICSDGTSEATLVDMLNAVPSMAGMELSSEVTCSEAYDAPATVDSKCKVALLDLGVKTNIIRCLTDRGCDVRVFPMATTADEMLAWSPDGIMLSNGPGDPGAMLETIETVKKLVTGGKPIFGICLGHQVLALSQGLKTIKMFNGHRGVNHPIKNLITGKAEITSQNHGFVVDRDSVEANQAVEVTHTHLNDDTVAGIAITGQPVFSVQYHPEASAGPHDSRYLFDQFVENMTRVEVLA